MLFCRDMRKAKIQFIALTIFSLVVICGCTENEKKVSDPFSEIDQLIKDENAADRFHGSLTIASGDSVLYQADVGIADRNWDVPVRSDTRFDIASVNKSFIAGLIMLAVEEGKISLQDHLVDVLSRFDYPGNFDPGITIHQMLTHTSGLPDYDAVPDEMKAEGFVRFKRLRFANEEYVDYISRLPAVAPPGQRFYYSNFAYHLLCIILEELYSKPFDEILQTRICEPLGLRNTFSSSENELVKTKLAEAYHYNQPEKKWYKNNFIDLSLGRRIFSTTEDLAKWANVMNSEVLLSKESLSLIRTNHLVNIHKDFSYGYGWVIIDPGSQVRMGNMGIDLPYMIHGGSTEGYKAMLININEGEYIIAFLSNVGNNTNEMKLAEQITKILLDKHE